MQATTTHDISDGTPRYAPKCLQQSTTTVTPLCPIAAIHSPNENIAGSSGVTIQGLQPTSQASSRPCDTLRYSEGGAGVSSKKPAVVCDGDVCYLLKKCREKVVAETSPPPSSSENPTTESCAQWIDFSPEVKKLFQQGPVWVVVGPPCAGKKVCDPFQTFMDQLQSSGGQLAAVTAGTSCEDKEVGDENSEVKDNVCGGDTQTPANEMTTTSGTSAIGGASWTFPRIKFTTDAQIAVCEKAISVFGRAPFFGLVNMPKSSAFVLDLYRPCACFAAESVANVFKPVTPDDVMTFMRKVLLGSWPKAMLGEQPPVGDVDQTQSPPLRQTFKAVQSTLPRLVRGEIHTISEAKQFEVAASESHQRFASSSQDEIIPFDRRSGAIGSGPLLTILTIWSPRCPCCPTAIRLIDRLIDIILSDDFRTRFPACPLVSMDATIRAVTLNLDVNEIPDSEWPKPNEKLEALASPSLRATRSPSSDGGANRAINTTMSPLSLTSNNTIYQEVQFPSTATDASQPEEEDIRTLPCIIAHVNGQRVGRFSGIRTARNVVQFVARAFGVLPGAYSSDNTTATSTRTTQPSTDSSWLFYLQSELARYEEDAEDANDDALIESMRKRSRSDRRL